MFREISAESGTAFLIVTHERAIAQQTDRILEVRDGRLVQDVRSAYVDGGRLSRDVASLVSRAAGRHDALPVRGGILLCLRHARATGAAARTVVGVAQPVELQVVALAVAGSNPVPHPSPFPAVACLRAR